MCWSSWPRMEYEFWTVSAFVFPLKVKEYLRWLSPRKILASISKAPRKVRCNRWSMATLKVSSNSHLLSGVTSELTAPILLSWSWGMGQSHRLFQFTLSRASYMLFKCLPLFSKSKSIMQQVTHHRFNNELTHSLRSI